MLADRVGESFRERRMEFFLRLSAEISRPVTLLDVGGTCAFWRDRVPEGFQLTILNVFDQDPVSNVRVVTGDACDLGSFSDKSFDIVFSNSVLGHVGGWDRQMKMAREIRRVGRKYFVQTPNQRFPLDWRTLVPFFHWLPPTTQAWFLQRCRIGRYERVSDPQEALHLASRVRNVTRKEIRLLFPEGAIVSERALGLTKSFFVYSGLR